MLPFLLAAAAPDDNAGPRAAQLAYEAAQAHGDQAALGRLLAPDFLFVRGSGRVGDRRAYLQGFAGSAVTAFDVTDRLFLRAAPDVAIAGGEGRIAGTEAGRPFRNRFRFSDTLVRRDGRWVVVYAQVTGLGD